MIAVRDPVREDFSECSSGNGLGSYYETKDSAIHTFESVLVEYGLCFDPADIIAMMGDDGRTTIDIYTDELECARFVGMAVLMWHRMEESGRWEFTGYIA